MLDQIERRVLKSMILRFQAIEVDPTRQQGYQPQPQQQQQPTLKWKEQNADEQKKAQLKLATLN